MKFSELVSDNFEATSFEVKIFESVLETKQTIFKENSVGKKAWYSSCQTKNNIKAGFSIIIFVFDIILEKGITQMKIKNHIFFIAEEGGAQG